MLGTGWRAVWYWKNNVATHLFEDIIITLDEGTCITFNDFNVDFNVLKLMNLVNAMYESYFY